MKSASIQEIKQELQTLRPAQLVDLCLRLSRFKKENKQLLTYLLFEAHDEEGFVSGVKAEIEELFSTVNLSQLYFAKKTLRKILRIINKYCRYSTNKQTEAELRIHFCRQLMGSGIPIRQNKIISNLYDSQLRKIESIMPTLHEDLQHDLGRFVGQLAR